MAVPSLWAMQSSSVMGVALYMFSVPVGLILTFFGAFVLRPALCVTLALEVADVSLRLNLPANLPRLPIAVAVSAVTAAVILRLTHRHSPAVLGAGVGAAIGISLVPQHPIDVAIACAPVAALACAFALVFAVVPEEVGIYVTAYGGSFLVWHGLSMVDNEIFHDVQMLPSLVKLASVDMWFNVLSFLLVGLIGVCTQLILLRNQRYTAVQIGLEYAEIP